MLGLRTPAAAATAMRLSVGGILVTAAVVLFLRAWLPVLTGQQVLIGVDFLSMCCAPWAAEHPQVAHNQLAADPPLEILPGQEVVADQWRQGRLPLWNPYALSGKPLLSNLVPAPFSLFTLLAVPFPAAQGLSLAMLLKLWAAGIGMAVFLRLLGARAPSIVLGGIAYATSSYIILWLAWPQASVAAIMPWAFAAAEWCLARGGLRAQAALATAIALQFVSGHSETSLHLGLALAVYSLPRWLLGSRDWRALVGLAVAAVLGTAAAAVQLVPFIQELRDTVIVSDRAQLAYGFIYLPPKAMLTWLVPNAQGNPIFDGPGAGFGWNYNESTGFATVAMLVLAPIGLVWLWSSRRSHALALGLVGLVAAGAIYGPLTPIVGRLPLLGLASSTRMTVILCFAVPALGALGAEAIWSSLPRSAAAIGRGLPTILGRVAGLAAGMVGLAGLAAGIIVVSRLGGGRAEHLWPALPHGYLTFWVAIGAAALLGALGFVLAGLIGRTGRVATAGLGLLVLGEAWLFAPHYQPMSPAIEVGAPTVLTTWLQQNLGQEPFAATGTTVLVPDSSTLYGLRDVRTYDAMRNARSRMFWSAADPGYHDEVAYTWLVEPRVEWLAMAGVRFVLTPTGKEIPETTPVFQADGVTVAEVPGRRPFAWGSSSWSAASGPAGARTQLLANISSSPVLEGTSAHAAAPDAPPAKVVVESQRAGAVDLQVSAPREQAVIIQQSWSAGWSASMDGRPSAVHPANIMFQAIVVPAGEHHVSLRYWPSSVTVGLTLSAAGVAIIVLLFTVGMLLPILQARRRLVVRDRAQASTSKQQEVTALLEDVNRDTAKRTVS